MAVRELIVFKHSKELGDCPAYKLFDAVKVQKNDDIQYPRKYQDYTVTINDDEIPDTVEVKRIHTHIAHQRKDYLHKESRKITNFYDIVCIEDLDLKTMSGEHHFGKSVHDNGWRMFTDFLQYKLEREGKKVLIKKAQI